MKKYLTPDFDVTIYEVEDVITASANPGDLEIGTTDPNGNEEDWYG